MISGGKFTIKWIKWKLHKMAVGDFDSDHVHWTKNGHYQKFTTSIPSLKKIEFATNKLQGR